FKIIEDEDYVKLNSLIGKDYTDQFSVFIFYKEIQKKINKILNPTIKKQLLGLEWFKVLVGSIHDIREIIKDNYYILSKLSPKVRDFEQYKKSFEDLYTNQLSSNDKLKREFFNIFTDVNVCPYCNRNFINPIYKEESLDGEFKKWSPDIEHFFPKSIYPFLSLSISNLLPSCTFCNKIKHDVDTYKYDCISPYEIKEGDFDFDFKLESYNVKEVVLKTNGYYNSKLFHIESLYNEVHKEYINNILNEPIKYPEVYKDKLNEKGNLSEDDYQELFRNYYNQDDFNKHPLAKMTKELMLKIGEYAKD
ncbi:MAG: hypothetical protein OQK11_08090, partial [Thiovulaceae bacterium]|nr:hypothetical protein [Sulfurimonadaceae bacterium]